MTIQCLFFPFGDNCCCFSCWFYLLLLLLLYRIPVTAFLDIYLQSHVRPSIIHIIFLSLFPFSLPLFIPMTVHTIQKHQNVVSVMGWIVRWVIFIVGVSAKKCSRLFWKYTVCLKTILMVGRRSSTRACSLMGIALYTPGMRLLRSIRIPWSNKTIVT